MRKELRWCVGVVVLAATVLPSDAAVHDTMPRLHGVPGRAAGLPQLFMAPSDLSNTWGLIVPRANQVTQQPDVQAPPGGGTAVGAFAVGSSGSPEWEVFVWQRQERGVDAVVRLTTSDMVNYSAPVEVWSSANCGVKGCTSWTVKSVARADSAGKDTGTAPHPYILGVYCTAPSTDIEGVFVMASQDGRSEHSFVATTTNNLPNFHDHDDVNLMWSSVRSEYVDLQIMFDSSHALQFCDNAGSHRRRVITVRNSTDGATWSNDWGCSGPGLQNQSCGGEFIPAGAIVPDSMDPPELQFYRSELLRTRPTWPAISHENAVRPFWVGERLMAHTLLYAPSPVVAPGWGLQPPSCDGSCCHGPHITDTWALGPSSGDPTDLKSWSRPWRGGGSWFARASPHDVGMMASPIVLGNASMGTQRHAFISNGAVWGVQQHRFAGLYAPANGVGETAPFLWPAGGVMLNADISWLGNTSSSSSCDEGCAAYVMVDLLFSANGTVVPGHEARNCVHFNVDSTRIPLVWGNGEGAQATAAAVRAQPVSLRLHWREAVIYSVYSGTA